MTSGLLDIKTPWPESLHPSGCECPSCIEGLSSTPLDKASSEDFGRLILGRMTNETGYPDLEIRAHAFSVLSTARTRAPRTPGESCDLWDEQGAHHGHHWYLLSNGHFKCDCGKMRVS